MNALMMPYVSYENETKSFRLIPISIDCPFNEMMFDVENKVLVVISKFYKKEFETVPKTSSSFNLSNIFSNNNLYSPECEQVTIDNYYQYFIEDFQAMINIIKHCCGEYYNDEIENIIFGKNL